MQHVWPRTTSPVAYTGGKTQCFVCHETLCKATTDVNGCIANARREMQNAVWLKSTCNCVFLWFGLESQFTDSSVKNDWNLISQRYNDDIIEPVLIRPNQVNHRICLAQNNEPCHVASRTLCMRAANRVRTITRLAANPDLIPI